MLIDSLDGGGAERGVLEYARALETKGVEVHLFVLRVVEGYDDARAFRTHHVPDAGEHLSVPLDRAAASLRATVAEVERTRGASFDLFLAHLPQSCELVAAARLEPAYMFVHNSFGRELKHELIRGPRRYLRMRKRLTALRDQHVVAISEDLRREVESSRIIRPASLRLIYHAFPVEQIRAMACEPAAGMPDEPFVVHVGRGSPQKRQDILFRAFRHVPEPYRLVCLSRHVDKLRKLAKRYGIADRLITPGFQQNPYAWLARARLMALSSDFEGLCRVLIESLICGTPVVSTHCPHGPAEILGEELAHWLVPVRRPDLLGAKIAEALETEIDLSRWRLIDEITTEAVADQLVALLDERSERA